MLEKVKKFDNKSGYGFIEYKCNGDVFIQFGIKNKKTIKNLNAGDCIELYLISTNEGYSAKYVNIRTNDKSKKVVSKEIIEIVTSIASILGIAFSIVDYKENKVENNIHIDCEQCKIEIIQESENNIEIDCKE